jgi:hypothetical protein
MADAREQPIQYAPLRGKLPQVPISRQTRIIIAVLACAGAIGLAIYRFVIPEIRHYRPAQLLPQIEVLRPEWGVVRDVSLIVGMLSLCAVSTIFIANRRILLGLGLAIVFFVAGVWALVTGFQFATATVTNRILAEDGTTYCGIDTSYEKGHEVAVGRLKHSGPLYQTVDMMAAAYLGRSPYVQVGRPPNTTTGTAIYRTLDGQIAVCYPDYEGLSC